MPTDGLYFREPGYSEDFDSVEHFLEEDVTSKFLEYIKQRPKQLGRIIDQYVLITPDLLEKYGDFRWIDYLSLSESALMSMNDGMRNLIELYKEARDYAKETNQWSLCKSYDEALRRLNTRNSLITYFTKYNVIPGYGFPVDNVELYIYDYEKQDMSDEYNLSRDLSLAISEYAPGSEVIVNERKYTSRYLFLPHNGYALPTTYYSECDRCHTINTSPDKNYFQPGRKCKYCDTPLDVSVRKLKSFVTPIHGFVADRKNKDTKRMKPFKTYASDTYYIGDSITSTEELNNVVDVTEHKNEELLVLNENRFFYCTACGYTTLDRRYQLPVKTISHNEYRGKKCTACGGKLNLTHLGHSYRTDIISIGFKDIEEMRNQDTAVSVLYAILEGISMTYDIERNDIGGLVYSVSAKKPYSLILFDTVAGGAGHVKRLKDDQSLLEVLKNALKKVSQECCDEDTSCYNCLRTYNNQRLHKHLKRGLARKTLTTILKRIQEKNRKYRLSKPELDFSTVKPSIVLEYDLICNETSEKALRSLFNEIDRQKAAMPNGFGYTLIADNEEEVEHVDFAWKGLNILLFTIERMASYERMVNSQNKYKCFLLSDSFDYVSFVTEELF